MLRPRAAACPSPHGRRTASDRPATAGFAIIHGHLPNTKTADMLELNPVRQRIADLTDRVVSLRGYL